MEIIYKHIADSQLRPCRAVAPLDLFIYISTYGQNTAIMSHKVVHRLYNYMFQPWVLAIFKLFTTYRSAIQYVVGFTLWGDDDDEILFYSIGRHGLVMFLTSVEISIV